MAGEFQSREEMEVMIRSGIKQIAKQSALVGGGMTPSGMSRVFHGLGASGPVFAPSRAFAMWRLLSMRTSRTISSSWFLFTEARPVLWLVMRVISISLSSPFC